MTNTRLRSVLAMRGGAGQEKLLNSFSRVNRNCAGLRITRGKR